MRARRALLVLVLVGTACTRTTYQTVEVTPVAVQPEAPLQTARNLPQSFVVTTPARVSGDCPPRLSDPSLGTSLILQQSALLPARDSTGTGYRALGDYVVTPRGRYGEGEGEGLRVDCLRLSALGVVQLRR